MSGPARRSGWSSWNRGAHSPDGSICAKAGTLSSIVVTRARRTLSGYLIVHTPDNCGILAQAGRLRLQKVHSNDQVHDMVCPKFEIAFNADDTHKRTRLHRR